MRKLFLTFLLFHLLFACTRSVMQIPSEFMINELPDESYHNIQERSSIDNIRSQIKNVNLSCAPGSCPDGIALITAVGQTNHEDPNQKYFALDSCTGVFTRLPGDKNQLYIATAGHCIPRRLQNSGAACEEDISIKVIKGARIKCENIEFVSAPSSEKFVSRFDFALLKVSTDVDISTYDLSQNPLKDPSQPYQVKMYSVDPQSENASYKIRETECWYLQNSYILPNSIEGTAPLMMSRGCALISGNSGAPLLDGGTVVGIQSNFVQYQDNIISDGSVSVTSNPFCFDIHKKNLRCKTDLELVFVDEEGHFDLPQYLRLLRSKDPRTLDANTKKALQLLAGDSKLFRSYTNMQGFSSSVGVYDFKSTNNTYVRLVFPSCYSPNSIDKNLKNGVQLVDKNVLSYGLSTHEGRRSENKFKLALEYSIFRPVMILQHLGDGVFRITSSVFHAGHVDIRLNSCL